MRAGCWQLGDIWLSEEIDYLELPEGDMPKKGHRDGIAAEEGKSHTD